MSLQNVFDIAGSSLVAQTIRLNTTASNMANADSMSADPNSVYRGLRPVFAAVYDNASSQPSSSAQVAIVDVVEMETPPEKRYEPGNPNADEQGFVYYSPIEVVSEMADMMSATRSYEMGVEIMSNVKMMQQSLLSLGK
ncbi:flagellar basal body rod protein FlgC [uncultured Umboniibacter sp.]|uniref:flagellar basal body rod protein FlgC n=1 Tax=uncultured Umboniibacter sp. TaxID=1798917 RepID=UPI00261C61BD|nr:flagellar basal body rod protein FlgC [uncultured Umboniibacter sp.]